MTVLPANRHSDVAWLAERCGYAPRADFRGMKAVNRYGQIVAMAGFDYWTPNSVHVHTAVEDPRAFMAKTVLLEVFRYVFDQAKREVAITITRAGNQRSLRFQRGLGFREKYRVRDGWAPGEDLVVQEMRRDDCRVLKRSDP